MSTALPQIDERTTLVTVCDKCLRASCWQGYFYCEEAKNAGTVEKPIAELRKLELESSHYWFQTE